MNVRELLRQTEEGLQAAGIENAAGEAAQIVCAVLGVDRSFFFSHGTDEVAEQDLIKINQKTVSRAFGDPLQYVIGTAAFMDMELGVDDRVLIPRPETELLAEQAEAFLKKRVDALPKDCADADGSVLQDAGSSVEAAFQNTGDIAVSASGLCVPDLCTRSARLSVLDMCTGSGAIALYLARTFPEASVTASDISQPALQVALFNNSKYDAGLNIVRSDLFENIEGKFDLITANPPYIPAAVIETLDPVVKDKEPRLALDGGDDGLDIVRRLISEAPSYLRSGGMLLMEHGHDQGEACRLLALNAGFASASTLKDLEGHDRILFARL